MTTVRKATLILSVVVLVRLLFHAFYWPAFEGPDEPFHLARMTAYSTQEIGAATQGAQVSSEIITCVKSLPCGGDLNRALGCRLFEDEADSSEFNILTASCDAAPGFESYPNYESHQPPLYYLLGAAVLSVTGKTGATDPLDQLLAIRLLSVFLVVGALAFPLRRLGRGFSPYWFPGVLATMLIPGAAESLIRCANDVLVFAWASVVVWDLQSGKNNWAQPLLLATGPLIKLTALPLAALSIVKAAVDRQWARASARAFSSLFFIPVQYLRGWAWGGTVELNAPPTALNESAIESLIGFVRSSYTFAKTTLWLGGWSFFRAPIWLLAVCGVAAVLLFMPVRFRPSRQKWLPYLAALAVAGLATVVFFLNHRLYYGQWGGVGGWYFWSWLPLLAALAGDRLVFLGPRRRLAVWSGIAALAMTNLIWFSTAVAQYS